MLGFLFLAIVSVEIGTLLLKALVLSLQQISNLRKSPEARGSFLSKELLEVLSK